MHPFCAIYVVKIVIAMSKQEQYQALIADVKAYYTAQGDAHKNEPVYLTWYGDCDEINLWTYWQGRGNLDAKIMLVGQDWGSPEDVDEQYAAQFSEINDGKRASYWLDGKSDTDKNLTELFHSLGYDISSGKPCHPDLFFTNFVLGYRNKGFSGSFQTRWLKENQEFFFRLANIIEPNVIICLGCSAFRGVMMAYGQKVRIGSYNTFITGKDNPVEVTLVSGQKTFVFAEAHCGVMGTLNRDRLKDTDGTSGIALQKKDWARIREHIKNGKAR